MIDDVIGDKSWSFDKDGFSHELNLIERNGQIGYVDSWIASADPYGESVRIAVFHVIDTSAPALWSLQAQNFAEWVSNQSGYQNTTNISDYLGLNFDVTVAGAYGAQWLGNFLSDTDVGNVHVGEIGMFRFIGTLTGSIDIAAINQQLNNG